MTFTFTWLVVAFLLGLIASHYWVEPFMDSLPKRFGRPVTGGCEPGCSTIEHVEHTIIEAREVM